MGREKEKEKRREEKKQSRSRITMRRQFGYPVGDESDAQVQKMQEKATNKGWMKEEDEEDEEDEGAEAEAGVEAGENKRTTK